MATIIFIGRYAQKVKNDLRKVFIKNNKLPTYVRNQVVRLLPDAIDKSLFYFLQIKILVHLTIFVNLDIVILIAESCESLDFFI